jgi:hypothetical protein
VIVNADFLNQWQHKGHCYGECMTSATTDLMYIHIPKNASSWTKPNLQDWGWEFYNYHLDMVSPYKHAIIVLRDPVDRWLSGIGEYFTLYHKNIDLAFLGRGFFDLVFDRIAFDDHTERQVNFISGIDTARATFFLCDKNYRQNFGEFVAKHLGENGYHRYDYQHVSENSPERQRIKNIFKQELEKNSKYQRQLKNYFQLDYELIEQVEFYGTR